MVSPRPPHFALAMLVAIGVSLAAHGLGYAVLVTRFSLPDPGIELQLPSEVELGLVDAPTSAPEPEPPAPVPDEPKPAQAAQPESAAQPEPAPKRKPPRKPKPDAGTPEPEPEDAGVAWRDGGLDAGTTQARDAEAAGSDAARPDAALERVVDAAVVAQRRPPSQSPGAAQTDAGARGAAGAAPPWQPTSAEGAQISLRLDLARIRASDMGSDIVALVTALPDVRALLDGSQVDLTRDLDRLLVASPDLSRERSLIAGRHTGGPAVPRRAAQNLAASAGEALTARTVQGLTVLPWHNRDATRRVLALLDQRHFVIARGQDLPRILSIARALGQRRKQGTAAPGEALLAMPAGAAASVEIEGVQHFVRDARIDVPTRAQWTLLLAEQNATPTKPATPKTPPVPSAPTQPAAAMRVRLYLASPAAAQRLSAHLRTLMEQLARHPLVQLTGLGSALANARVETDGDQVALQASLTRLQARTLLSTLRDAASMEPPARGNLHGATPP